MKSVNDIIRKYANCQGGDLFFGDPYMRHPQISFLAFIQEMNQTFSLSYDQEEVYGRNDPITSYRNTKRTLSLSWIIPSVDLYDAKLNHAKTRHLMRLLYPRYENLVDQKMSQDEWLKAMHPRYYLEKQVSAAVQRQLKPKTADPRPDTVFKFFHYMEADGHHLMMGAEPRLRSGSGEYGSGHYTDAEKIFAQRRENENNQNEDGSEWNPEPLAQNMSIDRGIKHTQTMIENPIVLIRYSNLISDGLGLPLMGYLDGLSIKPLLDEGHFTECQGEVLNPITKKKVMMSAGTYPRVYTISCNFNVIHTEALGYDALGVPMSDIFFI